MIRTEGREEELRRVYGSRWFTQAPLVIAVVAVPGEAWRRMDDKPYDEVDATIEKAMGMNDAPVVIDFVVHRDAMVWPMVAAGTSNDDIMIARETAPDWDSQEL